MSWESQNAQAESQFHQDIQEEEAIRLRILANSDSISDQALKRSIRDEVNEQIRVWVDGISDLEEAKEVIASEVPEIEKIVEEQLAKKGIDQSFSVDFSDVEFPTKLYGNMVYPAGVYDAVLITLGEGNGENWWCVLFPPLCFLDMENSEAQEQVEESDEAEEEVETSFFVVEMVESVWDRLFG